MYISSVQIGSFPSGSGLGNISRDSTTIQNLNCLPKADELFIATELACESRFEPQIIADLRPDSRDGAGQT